MVSNHPKPQCAMENAVLSDSLKNKVIRLGTKVMDIARTGTEISKLK